MSVPRASRALSQAQLDGLFALYESTAGAMGGLDKTMLGASIDQTQLDLVQSNIAALVRMTSLVEWSV